MIKNVIAFPEEPPFPHPWFNLKYKTHANRWLPGERCSPIPIAGNLTFGMLSSFTLLEFVDPQIFLMVKAEPANVIQKSHFPVFSQHVSHSNHPHKTDFSLTSSESCAQCMNFPSSCLRTESIIKV